MNKNRVSIISIMLVLLSGCVGSSKYAVQSLPGDSCSVYVFRDEFSLVWSMDIEADDQAYAQLSDNTYTNFKLGVGQRIVSAVWSPFSGGVDLDVPLDCKDKETYYINFYGYADGYSRTIKARYLSKEEAEIRKNTHQLAGS